MVTSPGNTVWGRLNSGAVFDLSKYFGGRTVATAWLVCHIQCQSMNEEGKEEYYVSNTSVVFYCGYCLLTVFSKYLLKGKGAFKTWKTDSVKHGSCCRHRRHHEVTSGTAQYLYWPADGCWCNVCHIWIKGEQSNNQIELELGASLWR